MSPLCVGVEISTIVTVSEGDDWSTGVEHLFSSEDFFDGDGVDIA